MLEKIYSRIKEYWSIVLAFLAGVGLFLLVSLRIKKIDVADNSKKYNALKDAKKKARKEAKELENRKQEIEEKYDSMIYSVEREKAQSAKILSDESEKNLTDMLSKEFNIKNLDGE